MQLFSKSGIITIIPVYCSWSLNSSRVSCESHYIQMLKDPMPWFLRVVKSKWNCRICSGAIITEALFSSGHSGNNVISLWGITLFILKHNKWGTESF